MFIVHSDRLLRAFAVVLTTVVSGAVPAHAGPQAGEHLRRQTVSNSREP